ncbi:MAG: hypothetical protein KGH88_06365 [Thaumarchaeota archaeon]|nr:hypothetical protein [Nitrososphaerota archaeon]
MTRIISGVAVAAIVLAIGMGTQISAFAMTWPQSDATEKITSQTSGSTGTMMLVAISPIHKGEKATFMLVPRSAENVDGIPIQKQAPPDVILVAQPSQEGGKPVLTWVPRPVEGIDGIPIPKPAQQNPVMETSQESTDPSPMMLVAISPIHKGGKATFMLVSRPAENVDGISAPKSIPDLIMVAHASANGGKPTFAWIQKPTPSLADHSS